VSQKELDLFQITPGLAAELGTGAAKIVSAEALDTNLPG